MRLSLDIMYHFNSKYQIHRLDGPAIIDGENKRWFIDGKHIPVNSQEEFERYMKLIAFK